MISQMSSTNIKPLTESELSNHTGFDLGKDAEPKEPRRGVHWGPLPRKSSQYPNRGTSRSRHGTIHQRNQGHDEQPGREPLPKSLTIGHPTADTRQMALPEATTFARRFAEEQLQGRYHPEPIRLPKNTTASVLEMQVRRTERPVGPKQLALVTSRTRLLPTSESTPTQVPNRLGGIITPELGSLHLTAEAVPFVA